MHFGCLGVFLAAWLSARKFQSKAGLVMRWRRLRIAGRAIQFQA